MPRRRRLHVPYATYYVVQLSSARQTLFPQPDHYDLFEALLANALRRSGTRAFAYCWVPHAIHLALQIGRLPLGRVLQGLTGSYARRVHRHSREAGHLFAQRHRALLIDPERWLLPLIRYIHYQPVMARLTSAPGDWLHSSHTAYLGQRRIGWLHTRVTAQLLEAQGEQTRAYVELMTQAPSDEEIRRFECGGAGDPRVLGDDAFLQSLPHDARAARARTSLEQIIDMVTHVLDVDRAEVLSKSRRRPLALARAVIAWYATERGVATLSEVGRRLRRDPSTLSLAIDRHRRHRPDLFALSAYRHLAPLA